jgi:hypothetical protein
MIISDLNYLEVVFENTDSVSGGALLFDFNFSGIPLPTAAAQVQIAQQAIGFQTSTLAQVQNDVVAGLFSKSLVSVTTIAVGAAH